MIVNHAPICVTCKYFRRNKGQNTVTSYTNIKRRFWFGWKRIEDGTRTVEWDTLDCAISRQCVDGRFLGLECKEERQRLDGCGPEGRNYVANPKWIAAMKEKGLEVHPDLMAMMEPAK
jgi:hypothetical protein